MVDAAPSSPEARLLCLLREAGETLSASTVPPCRVLYDALTNAADLAERLSLHTDAPIAEALSSLQSELDAHATSGAARCGASWEKELLAAAEHWERFSATILLSAVPDEEQLNELLIRDRLYLAGQCLRLARVSGRALLQTRQLAAGGDRILLAQLRNAHALQVQWLPRLRILSCPPSTRWWWYLDQILDGSTPFPRE